MIAGEITPSREEFIAAAARGEPQLLRTRRINDLETPVSALLKLQSLPGPKFLLESVEGGASRGRYSLIGLAPDLLWRCRGNLVETSRTPGFPEDSFTPSWDDRLSALKALVRQHRMALPDGLPPMAAGLIGFMGYGMVRAMERLPEPKTDPIAIPDACFLRPTAQLIFDAVDGVTYLTAPVWEHEANPGAHYDRLCAWLGQLAQQLNGPLDQRNYPNESPLTPLPVTSNVTRAEYDAMIAQARKYITAGDIFQVVLGQRFSAPYAHSPLALYRALRHLNPSPFLFYLDFGGYALVGSSPEILVRLRGDTVTIRPIAGTRKRGATAQLDAALAAELLADPKERAEHLMLLDLGRNDVGRVAAPGSVTVTQQMQIEYYSHVMHLVSNVEGRLRDGLDAVDALVAGFPAGTVSGAPKVRAMEIIHELEPHARSFYGGCVGYFGANGSMECCITLRTGLVKGGTLYAQAGGGVVADSSAEGEYQESLNKAAAVLRAGELAARFA